MLPKTSTAASQPQNSSPDPGGRRPPPQRRPPSATPAARLLTRGSHSRPRLSPRPALRSSLPGDAGSPVGEGGVLTLSRLVSESLFLFPREEEEQGSCSGSLGLQVSLSIPHPKTANLATSSRRSWPCLLSPSWPLTSRRWPDTASLPEGWGPGQTSVRDVVQSASQGSFLRGVTNETHDTMAGVAWLLSFPSCRGDG